MTQSALSVLAKTDEHRESCSHSVSRDETCLNCLDASRVAQPQMWEMIHELAKPSRFGRSPTHPSCNIENEDGRYHIRMVPSDDVVTIRKVHRLMQLAFKGNEVEPFASFSEGITGRQLRSDSYTTRYRLFVALDRKTGGIRSVYVGFLVNLQGVPESTYMGTYAVTLKDGRRKGLARELFISALIQAAVDATVGGTTLTTIAGDCTDQSEPTWNSMGRRRIYKEVDDNRYQELPFYQPALSFDKATGLPTEGAEKAAEHLMVRFVGKDLSNRSILDALHAMYRWCGKRPPDWFTAPDAYETYLLHYVELLNDVDTFLRKEGRLLLLSAQERESLRKQGAIVLDHGNGSVWE